jgi:hypothetical protein
VTRLVVHAGTHGTGWVATQRQLVSWRASLEEIGVHLHPGDDPGSWLSDGYNLAAGTEPSALVSAVDRAERGGADVMLLSSERLEDSLRDPARLAMLSSFADELGMPVTVLVVVRDQLGYLNQLYTERISHLQMARDFASFAADPSPPERFNYGTAFELPIAAAEIDFVAVPYANLPPGSEAKALLAAVGLDEKETAALPEADTDPREPLPGPVLVAAHRLLFKRLWRLGLLTNLQRSRLVRAGRALAAHALEHGWDTHPFWGWDETARQAAIARYRPGNDVFAEAVWGRPWGNRWETGDFDDVDLPALDPPNVVDILLAVDTIVQELQAAKASAGSE